MSTEKWFVSFSFLGKRRSRKQLRESVSPDDHMCDDAFDTGRGDSRDCEARSVTRKTIKPKNRIFRRVRRSSISAAKEDASFIEGEESEGSLSHVLNVPTPSTDTLSMLRQHSEHMNRATIASSPDPSSKGSAEATFTGTGPSLLRPPGFIRARFAHKPKPLPPLTPDPPSERSVVARRDAWQMRRPLSAVREMPVSENFADRREGRGLQPQIPMVKSSRATTLTLAEQKPGGGTCPKMRKIQSLNCVRPSSQTSALTSGPYQSEPFSVFSGRAWMKSQELSVLPRSPPHELRRLRSTTSLVRRSKGMGVRKASPSAGLLFPSSDHAEFQPLSNHANVDRYGVTGQILPPPTEYRIPHRNAFFEREQLQSAKLAHTDEKPFLEQSLHAEPASSVEKSPLDARDETYLCTRKEITGTGTFGDSLDFGLGSLTTTPRPLIRLVEQSPSPPNLDYSSFYNTTTPSSGQSDRESHSTLKHELIIASDNDAESCGERQSKSTHTLHPPSFRLSPRDSGIEVLHTNGAASPPQGDDVDATMRETGEGTADSITAMKPLPPIPGSGISSARMRPLPDTPAAPTHEDGKKALALDPSKRSAMVASLRKKSFNLEQERQHWEATNTPYFSLSSCPRSKTPTLNESNNGQSEVREETCGQAGSGKHRDMQQGVVSPVSIPAEKKMNKADDNRNLSLRKARNLPIGGVAERAKYFNNLARDVSPSSLSSESSRPVLNPPKTAPASYTSSPTPAIAHAGTAISRKAKGMARLEDVDDEGKLSTAWERIYGPA